MSASTNEPAAPLVSVIIPTYKRAGFLIRALRSVFEQTLTNLEAIVIVDGQDPETDAALSAVTDPRLRVIKLPQRVGGSETRNAGIRNARGEYIALLDDDDEWMIHKLELQLDLARVVNSENFLISCRVLAKTPRVEYEWPRRLPEPNEALSEYLLTRDSLFRGERSIQTSTFFAKRELFEKCMFRPGQIKHQDTDWLLRAAQLPGFRVFFVNEVLVRLFMEESRNTVSSESLWHYSYTWARENKNLFTPRAYSGFLVNNVAPEAADMRSLSAFMVLTRELIHSGNMRFREVCVFAAMFAMPRNFRRRLRDFVTRFRPALVRPS